KSFSHLMIPVLLQGEVGVGKKRLARLIHQESEYADFPFIHINSSMIFSRDQTDDLEYVLLKTVTNNCSSDNSILKGTIFLEDIDQLPQLAQHQLLKMIEEGKIKNPWSVNSGTCSLRLIASTTVDLNEEVSKGFRRSLYDCLSLVSIRIPPLRERRDEIKPLGIHFLEKLGYASNCNAAECRHRVDNDVWDLLINYQWPGNVQELATILSRIMLLGENSTALNDLKQLQQPESIQNNDTIPVSLTGNLKSIEQRIIKEMVNRFGGNKAAAARKLGIQRKTLYRILEDTKCH
ncbi:MAG: sigma 54-interacting transcriptional regulator, partial [Planctomycetota bacterium]